MADKVRIPFRFEVQVEELFNQSNCWHAQFKIYPRGYFRGKGLTPAAALKVAWGRFEREVNPGRRWWHAAR